MKNGHVLEVDSMICKLCGGTYEHILDKNLPCNPIPLLQGMSKQRCIECTLIREVFSCLKGWTCMECIEQIRADGVALRSG